jgi:hypothetical protein
MNPAEVLAVEIRQFIGQGVKTLIPRIIGQTAEAQLNKSPGSRNGIQWDETLFYEGLEKQNSSYSEVADKIIRWSTEQNLTVSWNSGTQIASFFPTLTKAGKPYRLFNVLATGQVQIMLDTYPTKPGFTSEGKRKELFDGLNSIDGVALPPEKVRGMPTISFATLAKDVALEQFLKTFNWVIDEMKLS